MRKKLCTFLLLSLMSMPAMATVKLQIEGLSGELQRNVRAHLSTIKENEVSAKPRFKRQVRTGITEGLQALGYFDPKIRFELIPRSAPQRSLLIAHVTLGEPVKIKAINIDMQGEAQQDPAFTKLLATVPKVGSILNQGDFDDFLSQLRSLALERGYFNAKVAISKLEVAPGLHEAFWNITFDSGRRYRFGKVTFTGSQIRENRLQGLIPFTVGQPYLAATLATFNQKLSETNWYRNIVIDPQFAKVGENMELPLFVTVTPKPSNNVELGLGYATDVGPRASMIWRKPWINALGHSMETKMSISQPTQEIEFGYRIPTKSHPLEKFYTLTTAFNSENQNDTKERTMSATVGAYWDVSSGWQRNLTMNISYSSFEQAEQEQDTFLLYPGVQFARTRSRGGLMPYWGDSQVFAINYANTAWLSDIDMLQLHARSTWIRSYATKHRFVGRIEAGLLESSDFDKVPPSLRFFAGGDRSIRGYKYKSISPRDSEGRLTGATHMATASLEYQYNVTGNWWGAAFYDTGYASNKFVPEDLKSGVGLGVRWASPLGPVRFDIAHPLAKDSSGVEFYIALGPEL